MAAGETTLERAGDQLAARLNLGGRTVIEARARIGADRLATNAGHSVYYTERRKIGGGREVARFGVPWVADAYRVEGAEVEFCFEAGSQAESLVGAGPQAIVSASFRRMTLVPYLACGPVS